MIKKKYDQCYDVSARNTDYLKVSIKRSTGKLPDMEVAKAYSSIISRTKLNNFSLLDVGCLTGHFFYTFKKKIKNTFTYSGIDPWKLHINAARKIWKKYTHANFKIGWAQKIPYPKNKFDIVICSNVITHIPEIKKPIEEMLRVAKKYLIIRTPIHNKSYRIQLVLNSRWFKFTNILPKNEFDQKGNPRAYEYYDVHSKDYFESVIKKIKPDAKITFIKDNFFSTKNINNKKDKKQHKTKVINGMQVSDLLILPHHFVVIKLL
jgi:ubiquinone/menaquinone biosynthesis C-methylase UbiE